jgi:cold-inducible RNA-binding protein
MFRRDHLSVLFRSDLERMSNIFVGNLTFRITEADICALFELYGEVQSVSLVKDPLSGNSRGFAFVQMSNPTDARDAILSVNHSILGGHSLRVKAARKPQGRGALLSGSRLVRPVRG